MNIIKRAKEVKMINKEGCTVDFNNIIMINEKVEVKLIPGMPKDTKYLVGKNVLVSRLVLNQATIHNPVAKERLQNIPSRLLVGNKDFKVTKGHLNKGKHTHFAVIAENQHLPIGTIIHNPIKQDNKGIYCYDTNGNSCIIGYDCLTGLLGPKRPYNKSKTQVVVNKPVTSPISASSTTEPPIVLQSKVIPESEVPKSIVDSAKEQVKDTYTHPLVEETVLNLSNIFNKDFLLSISKNIYTEEDVFTDLDGNIHSSLKDVLVANDSILITRVKNKAKKLVIDSVIN